MEKKSIFAGAKNYSVKITKSFNYIGNDDAKLNIEITDQMVTVEGNFPGGTGSIECRIKLSTDLNKLGYGDYVSNKLEIENVNDCQDFNLKINYVDRFKEEVKNFQFSFSGAWEFFAIMKGLKIVMETMDEVIGEVAKWK